MAMAGTLTAQARAIARLHRPSPPLTKPAFSQKVNPLFLHRNLFPHSSLRRTTGACRVSSGRTLLSDYSMSDDEESEDEEEEIEKKPQIQEPPEDEGYVELDEGFAQLGLLRHVRLHCVAFKEGPKGVGVFSTVDIPFMNLPRIVMEIPVELMVSVSLEHPWIFRPDFLPEEDPLFDIIESTDPETDSDLRLTCMMLLGCHQESNFWHLYTDFLPPPDECTSLLLSSEDELSALQNPELVEKMKKEKQRLVNFWEKHWKSKSVHPSVAALCETSEKFLWAASLVRTRAFPFHCIYSALRMDMHLLSPFVDMMNHSEKGTCFLRWQKMEQRLQVVLKPGQSIRKGQELTLDYMPNATNEDLMEKYGFSLNGNAWEKIDFSGTPAKVHRDTFLSTWDIFGPYEDYRFYDETFQKTHDESGWLLAAARSLPTWHKGYFPCLPSEEAEASLLLMQSCQEKLNAFPTTLEEDAKLLEKGKNKSLRWKSAMLYRMRKKEYLKMAMKALDMYKDSFR